MKIHNYLIFDGQCEAAFTFYAKCLGGTLDAMLRFGEAPDCAEMPAEYRERIMHTCLTVGDQLLMGSDNCPPHVYEGIKGCSVTLQVDSVEEAERLFSALGDRGEIQMPLQETFWAKRFGMLVDRFGVPWMINYSTCDQEPGR
ncbi:VOC family protein [Pseudomonas sp. LS44]|uniref:VOC family protein n=1 Tax=Pseudomonas sp. LS44 TaxID=1357074 RepID=UPI00215B2C7D|nr:VOC family protein [Pseudomonas sp. LS44]UVE19113.1 VOC family protein [Pseudomonas sp. LS44]